MTTRARSRSAARIPSGSWSDCSPISVPKPGSASSTRATLRPASPCDRTGSSRPPARSPTSSRPPASTSIRADSSLTRSWSAAPATRRACPQWPTVVPRRRTRPARRWSQPSGRMWGRPSSRSAPRPVASPRRSWSGRPDRARARARHQSRPHPTRRAPPGACTSTPRWMRWSPTAEPSRSDPPSPDRVLVDAPCSGLGVLGRRPDARSRIQPADVVDLAALQRALLAEAAPLVRTGGVLVYSVCTLTNAETLEIDDGRARRCPISRPRIRPANPGAAMAGARCSCRRPPGPTACTCSASVANRTSGNGTPR